MRIREEFSRNRRLVAGRAISERRHIVIELIGADLEPLEALTGAMRAIGYRIDGEMVTCDVEEALLRNCNRTDDSISALYCEPYQRSWLLEAAKSAIRSKEEMPRKSALKTNP